MTRKKRRIDGLIAFARTAPQLGEAAKQMGPVLVSTARNARLLGPAHAVARSVAPLFKEIDEQPPAEPAPVPARRGRREGRVYEAQDAPLVLYMHELLERGQAATLNAAAVQVAERAAGGGSAESKVRRLTDAYKRKHGAK